jgi:hypothetical protein
MGTLLGLYEIVEFSKITKESTDLHENNTPNVICRETDTLTYILTYSHLLSQYSGISSHSFGHLYIQEELKNL